MVTLRTPPPGFSGVRDRSSGLAVAPDRLSTLQRRQRQSATCRRPNRLQYLRLVSAHINRIVGELKNQTARNDRGSTPTYARQSIRDQRGDIMMRYWINDRWVSDPASRGQSAGREQHRVPYLGAVLLPGQLRHHRRMPADLPADAAPKYPPVTVGDYLAARSRRPPAHDTKARGMGTRHFSAPSGDRTS